MKNNDLKRQIQEALWRFTEESPAMRDWLAKSHRRQS
jgi:hypothetical protein